MSDASVRIVFSGSPGGAVGAAKSVEGSFLSLGKVMKSVAGVAIGVGIIRGLKAAGKAALDFDASMRNVNSIAGLGEKQFEKLSTQVLRLAGPTAKAPAELADGLYDIVSSGFKANEAIKILAVSGKAATAGLTTVATSTKAINAALNAYNLEAKDAQQISDVLFQTVNKGVLTFEDLAQNMGDLVPVSAPLGVSLEEVGAAIATITLQGVPAAEAATRVKNSMLALSNPGEELTKVIKGWGFETGQAAIEALGFDGVLQKLQETTHGNVAAVQGLFTEQRAALGILGLLTRGTKLYDDTLKSMAQATEGAGATQRAFSEQAKSLSFQWARAKAAITAAAIPIATLLFPALVKGTEQVGEFAARVRSAFPEIKQRFGDLSNIVGTTSKALLGFAKTNVGVSVIAGSGAILGLSKAAKIGSTAVKALMSLSFGGWAAAGAAAVGLLVGGLTYLAQQSSLAEKQIAAVTSALEALKSAGDTTLAATDANAAAQSRLENAALGVKIALAGRAEVEKQIAAGTLAGKNADLQLAIAQQRVKDAYRERTQAARDARAASEQLTVAQRQEQEEARRTEQEVAGLVRSFQRVKDVISEAEGRRAAGGFVDPRALSILKGAAQSADEYAKALDGAKQAAHKLATDESATALGRKTAAGIEKALGALRKYVKQTGEIPTRLQTETILKDNGVPAKIRRIIMEMLGFPKKLSTTVDMRDEAKGKIKDINKELDRLKSQKPTVKVAAQIEKLEEAKAKLQAFLRDIKKAGDKPVKARLELLNDKFDGAMKRANSALKKIDGASATPEIRINNTPALAAIGAVDREMDSIDGRTANSTITITTNRVTNYRTTRAGGAHGGFAGTDIGGPVSRAIGGFIPGGWSDTAPDSVPAILKPGELVLNRPQQNMLGGPAYLAGLFGFSAPSDASGGAPQPLAGGGFVSGFTKRLKSSAARDRKNSGYKSKLKAVEGLQRRLDANRERQDRMARSIGQDDTQYSISVEEFIKVDDNGNESLDTGAVAQRLGEIDKLVARKNELMGLINEETGILTALINALDAAVKAYQAEIRDQQRVIREMTDLIKDATGKMKDAPDEAKAGYEKIISTAEGRRDSAKSKIDELRGLVGTANEDKRGVQKDNRDQPLDLRDVELEIMQLNAERAEVASIKPRPAEPTSAADSAAAEAAGADVGGSTGDTGAGGPDLSAQNQVLEQIASDLRKQVATLKLALGVQGVQLPIINSFQLGALHVPQTGLYQLHAGEQVRPAGYAKTLDPTSGRVVVELLPDPRLLALINLRVKESSGSVMVKIGKEADITSRSGLGGGMSAPVRRLS